MISGAPETQFHAVPGGGFYVLNVIDAATRDELISIEARRLRRESGRLYAEIDIRCEWAGVPHINGTLTCGTWNLSSQQSRKALAKHCAERARTQPGDFDWLLYVDSLCLRAIQEERTENPSIVLDDAPVVEAVTDHDIISDGSLSFKIPADATSFLVAPGDRLKSLLALYIGVTLARRGIRVLFCDWEMSAHRHRLRKERFIGNERLDNLRYQQMQQPLPISLDSMRRECDRQHVDFLIVDWVSMAVDGKMTDDDTALRFHRALRQLPTTLALAHVSKSTLDARGIQDALAFGSILFTNLSRCVWVIQKTNDTQMSDTVMLGLWPTKQNSGVRYKPLALEFAFYDALVSGMPSIDVTLRDISTVPELATQLPLQTRIQRLVVNTPMTAGAIAEALGTKPDAIYKVVVRNPSVFQRLDAPGEPTRIRLRAVNE